MDSINRENPNGSLKPGLEPQMGWAVCNLAQPTGFMSWVQNKTYVLCQGPIIDRSEARRSESPRFVSAKGTWWHVRAAK